MDNPFEADAIINRYDMLDMPDKVTGRATIDLGAADCRIRLCRLTNFADWETKPLGRPSPSART
jgi:hypothetical protein